VRGRANGLRVAAKKVGSMFKDRHDAGISLVSRLNHLRGEDTIVLGLPRGGVPVAAEIARSLGLPLDIVVVRKVGLPGQPELAMAAVGEGGVRVINERVVRSAYLDEDALESAIGREQAAVAERAARLRAGRERTPLTGRTAVLVDDGVATGASMRAACLVVREEGAARIVVATPIASVDALALLRPLTDEIVCLSTPHPFMAVGNWYVDFSPVDEVDVVTALAEGQRPIESP
jgi:putative phosphoribosyl transferase